MEKGLSVKNLLLKILSLSKPFRKVFGIVFACILFVTVISAVNNLFFSKIFNLIQKHGTDIAYLKSVYLLLGASVFCTILRIFISNYQAKMEIKHIDVSIPNILSHDSIAKFFSFSNGQHINEHSGVKQNIINSGVNSIQNQFNVMVYRLFPAVAQFITAICVMFYSSWIVGSLFVVIGSVFVLLMYKNTKKIVPGMKKLREKRILNSRLYSEMYRFVNLIKNENQESSSLNEILVQQKEQQDLYSSTWIPGMKRIKKIQLVSNIGRYLIISIAIYFLFKGNVSMGSLFLILTYSSSFVDSLWQFTSIHKQFLMDKINIEKYFETIDILPDIAIVDNPIRPKSFYGQIEFKNVSFYYPNRIKSYEDEELNETLKPHPVLKDISFVINAGEKIGIVGESGSGKTSLINLLRRAFDPQKGQILIDGHDLRLMDLKYFLQNLGSVDQEVVMLDRSIKDNILFGLECDGKEFDSEELKRIADLSLISGFFDRLEYGFDTLVGEKGVKLSGGERQRVGIARALAKNPTFLVFDEATSSLDTISEHTIQKAIDNVSEGKTTIIIAHRLSTVKKCDRIFVFRHGILIAEGTHSDLLNTSEYYTELVRNQMFV